MVCLLKIKACWWLQVEETHVEKHAMSFLHLTGKRKREREIEGESAVFLARKSFVVPKDEILDSERPKFFLVKFSLDSSRCKTIWNIVSLFELVQLRSGT